MQDSRTSGISGPEKVVRAGSVADGIAKCQAHGLVAVAPLAIERAKVEEREAEENARRRAFLEAEEAAALRSERQRQFKVDPFMREAVHLGRNYVVLSVYDPNATFSFNTGGRPSD